MESEQTDNLKILTRCITDIEAELIVQMLDGYGIKSFVETNIPHSVWPVSADALVIVREEDYPQAKKILQEYIENQNLAEEENIKPISEEEGD